MAEVAVKPARAGMNLRHPTAGVLRDEGGRWPADQFTFRRIGDGDIIEVIAAPVEKRVSPAPDPVLEIAAQPAVSKLTTSTKPEA